MYSIGEEQKISSYNTALPTSKLLQHEKSARRTALETAYTMQMNPEFAQIVPKSTKTAFADAVYKIIGVRVNDTEENAENSPQCAPYGSPILL